MITIEYFKDNTVVSRAATEMFTTAKSLYKLNNISLETNLKCP